MRFLPVFFFAVCALIVSTAARECIDEWKEICLAVLKDGKCRQPGRITLHKKKCAKSCGFCEQKKNCKDKFEDSICRIYARFGWCRYYQSYMSEWCSKTCDFCKKN
ncbi:unnamed protein product [Nippostrongylus brasiliensis]|uniref:ShKT domain-containing protein n=1 Tax=Nippostrongylus brasiliensis TaxID=27835 RepID=A0A0N4Y8P4_NIPBR|nr:unnamed protein product [Nippostrongylus brasiliensis]